MPNKTNKKNNLVINNYRNEPKNPLTTRFLEFIDLKYRGKLRAFTTELKIPPTQLYENIRQNRLEKIPPYMIKLIANRWPDIDTNYIQTGVGAIQKENHVLEEPFKYNKLPKNNDLPSIALLLNEVSTVKNEVIAVQKVLIKRTEQLVDSKDEVIKRDHEIKKVLYDFNAHLIKVQSHAT